MNSPQPKTLHDLIAHHAAHSPEAPAIEAPSRKPLSYRGLLTQMRSIAECLYGIGIRRSDRVATVLPNCPETAVCVLGISSVASSAPLNPGYKEKEFEFYLTDLDVRALLVLEVPAILGGKPTPAIGVAETHGIPVLRLSPVSEAEAGSLRLLGGSELARKEPEFALPGDAALVMHTSGTTARPKIVPLSHANLCAAGRNFTAHHSLTPEDRYLNIMPLFHMHAWQRTVPALYAGGSAAYTPPFDPTLFFAWVKEMRPTWYSAAPTLHQAILTEAATNQDIIAARPFRFIGSSAAALPRVVAEQLEEKLRAPVIECFGSSETCQIVGNPLPPAVRKLGTVGKPFGAEVRLLDQQGQGVPAGQPGEITVRGESVISAYANNPKANEKAFFDGWFRTGDVGVFDEDTYLTIQGRIKEIIIRGGENISPREVDEVLMEHPQVAQVATFGIPHPSLGEDVAAAAVLNPPPVAESYHGGAQALNGTETVKATEAELRAFAAERLATYKVPRRIVIVDAIPKGPSGKLSRAILPELLGFLKKDKVNAPGSTSSHNEADGATEAIVLDAWRQVLDREDIALDENFFELGGDSLRATQVIYRIGAAIQVDLPLTLLFEHPTVRELAAHVEEIVPEAHVED